MIRHIINGIGNFAGSMAGEFIDWLAAVAVELGDRLGGILDTLLRAFSFVPRAASLLGTLAGTVFFFLPDIALRILYAGVSAVGVILVIKTILKFLGR